MVFKISISEGLNHVLSEPSFSCQVDLLEDQQELLSDVFQHHEITGDVGMRNTAKVLQLREAHLQLQLFC